MNKKELHEVSTLQTCSKCGSTIHKPESWGTCFDKLSCMDRRLSKAEDHINGALYGLDQLKGSV